MAFLFNTRTMWSLSLQKQRAMAASLVYPRICVSRLCTEHDAEKIKREKGTSPIVSDEDGDGSRNGDGEGRGIWKWSIRKRIWDLLERENVASYPRPVHHRIPNFVGAPMAASKVNKFSPRSKASYLLSANHFPG